MNTIGIAVVVEARKALGSRVVPWTSGILVLGLAALTAGLLTAAAAGDERVLARLGPLAEEHGWTLLVGTAAQILAAGGFGACGILIAWLYGREFADGTIGALFALPVPRSTIALGKLIVYLAWAVIMAGILTVMLGVIGVSGGLLSSDPGHVTELLRIPVLTLLTALLAVPAAWIASIARSILAGIAATIVLLIVAQVSAVLGVGIWVPLIAPAIWAIDPHAVPWTALLGVPTVPLVFGSATAYAWARMQLDR
ncbi:MAG: elastin (supravalvular aortic stenosis, Williams-Beuren syndrome)-like protein [Microbacterium sp.]|uniref:ABC transporter permease n=1 Tax=Microbacterium sp. TaxID=51671 RepID=UPI002624178B|nr:ABC transporter permease [Microbacterium sp.]MDF2562822.1 elastin (supravalvular aortic stenosis, Williams-Beuren syndrome)-like protein [Microbacterium sp.]